MDDMYPSGKGRGFHIFLCLQTGFSIYVDCVDISLAALCQHQGDQSGPRTDIQDTVASLGACPCAEQNTVGSYLHRALIVADGKLFELKIGVRHVFIFQLSTAKVVGLS
jgi:hypothetical protein